MSAGCVLFEHLLDIVKRRNLDFCHAYEFRCYDGRFCVTYVYKIWVHRFTIHSPDGTIVNLGCNVHR